AGLRIKRWPAPLRGTVESRKDDSVLADGKRNKLAFTAKFSEIFKGPAVGFRCALGQHVFAEDLAGEGRGLGRKGLLFGRDFAWNSAGRVCSCFEREERFAGLTIEKKDEALLRGLRDGVDRFSVMLDCEQHGRRRKVAIPDVVAYGLKVPEAFAGARVESQQTIGVEIVANPVDAVKIGGGGAGWNVDDAASIVESHAGPIVRGAAGFPCVGRPSLIAGLARMRNGVKSPAKFAGADLERANVAGRRGQSFRHSAPDDDQVFKNNAGAGEIDGIGGGGFPAEIFTQVDAAIFAKARNGLAGGGVERVQIV